MSVSLFLYLFVDYVLYRVFMCYYHLGRSVNTLAQSAQYRHFDDTSCSLLSDEKLTVLKIEAIYQLWFMHKDVYVTEHLHLCSVINAD